MQLLYELQPEVAHHHICYQYKTFWVVLTLMQATIFCGPPSYRRQVASRPGGKLLFHHLKLLHHCWLEPQGDGRAGYSLDKLGYTFWSWQKTEDGESPNNLVYICIHPTSKIRPIMSVLGTAIVSRQLLLVAGVSVRVATIEDSTNCLRWFRLNKCCGNWTTTFWFARGVLLWILLAMDILGV